MIQHLTQHPELLNRETLYELRRQVAAYPYYQPARLLLLRNLYLLHDPSFDDELRRAAVYFTDRRVLFNLVEAAHYKQKSTAPHVDEQPMPTDTDATRTDDLIDNFLSTIPADAEPETEKHTRRKPTAADATVDYVAYLVQTDFEELGTTTTTQAETGNDLIDNFLAESHKHIKLNDNPDYVPDTPDNTEGEGEVLTETLAGIYIKQQQYERALGIITQLSGGDNASNPYLDDQQRFLRKLIRIQKAIK